MVFRPETAIASFEPTTAGNGRADEARLDLPPSRRTGLENAVALSLPLWIIAALGVLVVNRVYATLDWASQMGEWRGAFSAYKILAIDELGTAAAILLLAAVWPARFRALGLALFILYAVVYWVDVQVLKALWHRLTIPYIGEYIRQPAPVLWFFGSRRLVRNLLLVALPASVIYYALRRRRWTVARGRGQVFAALAVLGGLAVLPWTDLHCRVHNRIIEYFARGLLQFNAGVLLRRGTDPAVASRVRTTHPEIDAALLALYADRPPAPAGHRRNVILVISESLSRVDSLRSGLLYDRLPRIDSIQKAGMTLTNVVSDGENTSDALASLLIGVPPYPTAQWDLEMSKRFPLNRETRNLAARAHASGYSTALLSNAPLEMDGDGEWVQKLGFQRVVGGRSPEFDGRPGFVFGAPSDEALYELALEHIRKQESSFFLVLLTVSLHKPYVLPDERDRVPGEPFLSQLAYVDRTSEGFYRALRQMGFFDDGLLVIVGDHRRMTALEPAEQRSLGIDATGRVLCAIVGADVTPGAVSDALLNQSDVSTLLYDALDGKSIAEPSTYSKAEALRIASPFAVTVADNASGVFAVRRPGVATRELQFHPDTLPEDVTSDPVERSIAAYIVLQTDWLHTAQERALPIVAAPP
jgi:hypothetical protein